MKKIGTNENQAITLIALIITIIILLILAGITIGQLTGNGIFESAKTAKEKYEDAQQLENSMLSEYENALVSVRTTPTVQTQYPNLLEPHQVGVMTYTEEGNTITKKVYEKILTGTLSEEAGTDSIDVSDLDIYEVIDLNGTVGYDSTGWWMFGGNPNNTTIWYNSGYIGIYFETSHYSSQKYYITIRYTKNIDI